MWIQENPNYLDKHTGDCTVRALSIVFGKNWIWTYLELCIQGLIMAQMPSDNQVWDTLLRSKGFQRETIPNTCPDCYTVKDFCDDHKSGIYVLGTGNHVVAVVDGNYIDDWDSGNEVPLFVWSKVRRY